MLVAELEPEEGIRALDRMLSSIEHVLLEEVAGELFLSKKTPAWFDQLADLEHGWSIFARLPFLESFLPEAREFWKQADKDSHIQSDFWTQNSIHGEDIHLLAYALFIDGRRLLLIHQDEELYKEQESYQTYIHERILSWKAVKHLVFNLSESPEQLTKDSGFKHKVCANLSDVDIGTAADEV